MEYITLFFEALLDLSNEMAIYILFGLLFAGVMHELIPETLVTKHLGKDVRTHPTDEFGPGLDSLTGKTIQADAKATAAWV